MGLKKNKKIKTFTILGFWPTAILQKRLLLCHTMVVATVAETAGTVPYYAARVGSVIRPQFNTVCMI